MNHKHTPNGNASTTCECCTLSDKRGNGKERPWAERKGQSRAIAAAYECLPDKDFQRRAEKVRMCGGSLRFASIVGGSAGPRKRFVGGMFCKDRLCPMCQWRRSIALHRQLTQVVTGHLEGVTGWDEDGAEVVHVAPRPKDRAIFLNLTMKNVPPEKLPAAIGEIVKAFDMLRRYAPVRRVVTSWFRALEVTRNPKTGEYHPHLHVLLMVPETYFKKSFDGYLQQADWVALWQKALKVDYAPIVHISAVKGTGGAINDGVLKALNEVTKYVTKPADFFADKGNGRFSAVPEEVKTLHESLKGRRLYGWGGYFKAARKALTLQDVESDDADLVGPLGRLEDGEEVVSVDVYRFQKDPHTGRYDYVLHHKLTPEEHFGNAQGGERSEPPDRRERGKGSRPPL